MPKSQQSSLTLDQLRDADVSPEVAEGLVGGDGDVLAALSTMESRDEMVSALAEPWYENGHYAEMRDRPRENLESITQRIATAHGNVFVTINVDPEGRPFELFANTGSSGGYTNAWVEALSMTISIALRSGVDPSRLTEHLIDIRGPKTEYDNGEEIPSVPAGIGVALDRYLKGDMGNGRERHHTNGDCPECGSQDLFVVSGEKQCRTCGWSESEA